MLKPWILIAVAASGLNVSQHYTREEAAQALVELNVGQTVAESAIYAVQYGELVLSVDTPTPKE